MATPARVGRRLVYLAAAVGLAAQRAALPAVAPAPAILESALPLARAPLDRQRHAGDADDAAGLP
ncbi:MAG TPA: hypothetical protein VFJ02_01360 [Vicinamibacterales bacterium]|nr:hypothetical protein [Vicinamibacterales bacterium]